MGTRATVKFLTDNPEKGGEVMLNIYYQFDGYHDGVGFSLADFLKSKKVINGINSQTMEQGFANGIGCLAAQYLKEEKTTIGGVYIEPIGNSEYFDYKVWVEDFNIIMSVDEFTGSPTDFESFVESLKEE